MFQTVIEAGADGTVHRGSRARSASRRPASSCSTSTSPTSTSTPSRTPRMAARWHNALQALAEQHAARHPGHDLDRPAARVHRERRRLLHGQGVLAVARAARPRRAARRRRGAPRSPTSPGRSTPPSASGPRCTRRSTSPPSRGGRARRAPSGRTPTSSPSSAWPTSRASSRTIARAGQRRLHEQALPRRRPAEGRRGRALPLRPRAGLPRRAVRRPPQAVPADHRGRHRRDHALLRDAGRARGRRREDRGGRLRLQPPGRHRAAARAARLRRRRRHRLGARQRQPRRRPGAAGARLGRRAPRPARADGAASSHAGADQFGGEECVDILLDLVAQGRVTEARIDESARRLLAVKFRLGLFDDPFVDEDAAARDRGPRGLPRRGVRRPGPVGDRAAATAPDAARRAAAAGRAADLRRERLARGGGRGTASSSTGPRTPTSRWCG